MFGECVVLLIGDPRLVLIVRCELLLGGAGSQRGLDQPAIPRRNIGQRCTQACRKTGFAIQRTEQGVYRVVVGMV